MNINQAAVLINWLFGKIVFQVKLCYFACP